MHTWPQQRRVRAGIGFFLAALLLTSSALAEPETNDLTIDQKYVAQFAVPASDLKVTAWVDHQDDTYRVGDTLKLFVKTNLDAFITVVDVGTSGKVVVLFPNKHASDNRIGADKVLEIPGPKAPYDIRVSGPAGQELIKVIATTRPGAIIRADQLSELGPFQSYSGSAESFAKDLSITLKPTAPTAPGAAGTVPKDATIHKVIRIVAPQGPTAEAPPQPPPGQPAPPTSTPPPPGQPAPPTSPPPPPPTTCNTVALERQPGIERCFGGIGQGCKSQTFATPSIPPANLIDFGIPAAALGADCMISEAVSVGSIMHDNCCLSSPDGIYCKEDPPNFGREVQAALTPAKCHREWRKAVYDVLEHRYWFVKFGPYFANDTGDPGLNPTVPARQGFTYGPFGVKDQPLQWTGPERPATARLKAPTGQKLEYQDAAFCASGRFREEVWCMAAPPTCSGTAKLNGKSFLSWKTAKQAECDGYWLTDPRKAACTAHIIAEETTYNNRASHWGICQ